MHSHPSPLLSGEAGQDPGLYFNSPSTSVIITGQYAEPVRKMGRTIQPPVMAPESWRPVMSSQE